MYMYITLAFIYIYIYETKYVEARGIAGLGKPGEKGRDIYI